jgi:hypothetical protein
MPDEPTLTLREAALRIAKISGSRSDKIEDSKLLGLLVAGHLKAGFHCPGHSYLGSRSRPVIGKVSTVLSFELSDGPVRTTS